MKPFLVIASIFASSVCCFAQSGTKTISLTKSELKNKIKGGWAGQTIGVTFGGPYEFRFNGTFIQEYQPLEWYDGYLKKTMLNIPGLYDDVYMDLTFVDVFEKYGLDAPVDSFAQAYANAGYMLWHANQAGRYNILNGIRAPESGHWLNNPHADDIDYQIESDFAGLMSPGMPNTASVISDKIGHIMNYGDGWYGGVYVGALYTLAFVEKDINKIVGEALKTVPKESEFHQCIADVIRWHKQYPNDWHQNWFEIQKKWSAEIGCPDGVFNAFNIDAKINAAYVVLGLLYGAGDFTKTLDVSTRAGQDADCNPSTAAGVLGTLLGYDQIPAYWKQGLAEAESIDFKYTTMSLNKVYETSFKHALQNIERNGGKIKGEQVTITVQNPKAVKMERSFGSLYPVQKKSWRNRIHSNEEFAFDFDGAGFVITGSAFKKDDKDPDQTLELELIVDGKKAETIKLPAQFTTRRYDLCWKYDLQPGNHKVAIRLLNASEKYGLQTHDYIVYKKR
jgi:hypothetical protein